MQKERQLSEQEHQLLRRRIEMLTEELDSTRLELEVKARECDELMEVAGLLKKNVPK